MRRQCDKEGRDQNEEAIRPGVLAASRTGETRNWFSPEAYKLALMTPVNTLILNLLISYQTSDLQNC